MTARCGAAVLCRGATTVRQLPHSAHETSGGKVMAVWIAHERVQLQQHAKLVAIQTETCPPVRSTQPANTLHALIYMIHTVSLWKSLCNCLDCHEFSSRKTKTNDETGNRRAKFAKVEQLSGHAVPRSNNCQQLSAAPHLAVMGIKQHPVERPVEHACAEAPRDPCN